MPWERASALSDSPLFFDLSKPPTTTSFQTPLGAESTGITAPSGPHSRQSAHGPRTGRPRSTHWPIRVSIDRKCRIVSCVSVVASLESAMHGDYYIQIQPAAAWVGVGVAMQAAQAPSVCAAGRPPPRCVPRSKSSALDWGRLVDWDGAEAGGGRRSNQAAAGPTRHHLVIIHSHVHTFFFPVNPQYAHRDRSGTPAAWAGTIALPADWWRVG